MFFDCYWLIVVKLLLFVGKNSFPLSFLFINKTLWLNNLKTRIAMNVKTLVFVIWVQAIIYFLLYNFHDSTFNMTFGLNMIGGIANTTLKFLYYSWKLIFVYNSWMDHFKLIVIEAEKTFEHKWHKSYF